MADERYRYMAYGTPLTVLMNIPVGQVPDNNSGPNQRPDVIPGVPLTMTLSAANSNQLINLTLLRLLQSIRTAVSGSVTATSPMV
jgi:hypothetical protein